MAEFFKHTSDLDSSSHTPEEYDAGYRARCAGEAEYNTATRSWRAGWLDANCELGDLDSAASVAENDAAPPEQWSLYGTGREARACELPFDLNRGEAWKRSWIQTDIEIGTVSRRRHA